MPSTMTRQRANYDSRHRADLDLLDDPLADQVIELRPADWHGANRLLDRASRAFGERDDCLRLPEPFADAALGAAQISRMLHGIPSFRSRSRQRTAEHEGSLAKPPVYCTDI